MIEGRTLEDWDAHIEKQARRLMDRTKKGFYVPASFREAQAINDRVIAISAAELREKKDE